MTPYFARGAALLMAAAVSAGNVSLTQALAHRQVLLAEKASLGDAAVSHPASRHVASVATMKAMWR
jgi:hypothetical protein